MLFYTLAHIRGKDYYNCAKFIFLSSYKLHFSSAPPTQKWVLTEEKQADRIYSLLMMVNQGTRRLTRLNHCSDPVLRTINPDFRMYFFVN